MTTQAHSGSHNPQDAHGLEGGVDLIDVIRIGAGRKTFMSPEIMRAMGLGVGDRLAFGRLPDGTVVVKKVEF
ncbi:MAG TPA: hypothetical protein VM889_06570 [Candidatus Thermoplasmatota archaeon]|nr:hypothetical protein [Candidatus Thermoplasmatota archaeon]